ncbi:hypothetical protein [Rhizobium chutanense]|uniref:hypothetical protein n=1 Tax=Rhizobium chutanense TaxID=2035448 RepID=UPI0015CF0872|nr:hypothetical protein [Rhizobium chutanense]
MPIGILPAVCSRIAFSQPSQTDRRLIFVCGSIAILDHPVGQPPGASNRYALPVTTI